MMRGLLFTTALAATALALGNVARADVIIGGVDYYDPTSFHVTATGATGSDPVLLNNGSTFSIQDVGGQNIDQPLTIYLAVPTGAAAPTISGASYTATVKGVTKTTTIPSADVGTLGTLSGTFATGTLASPSTSDLYTFVGCVACDNSLNGSNITTVFNKEGITLPNSLTVYDFTVSQAFQGKDEVNITGAFANGTIVFPFAETGAGTNSVTIYDTSWTNTGYVDCVAGQTGCSVTPPPPPPVSAPEPASIAIFGSALLGLVGLARRRRKS